MPLIIPLIAAVGGAVASWRVFGGSGSGSGLHVTVPIGPPAPPSHQAEKLNAWKISAIALLLFSAAVALKNLRSFLV